MLTKARFIIEEIFLSDGEYIQTEEGLQRQGYGVHTTSDGLSYHGNWDGDKMNGHGEYALLIWKI